MVPGGPIILPWTVWGDHFWGGPLTLVQQQDVCRGGWGGGGGDVPLQSLPSPFWVLGEFTFILVHDFDAILCYVAGRHFRLLVDSTMPIQHVYNPIARVDTRKTECIAELLGSLQTPQERRGNDVMNVLLMKRKFNQLQCVYWESSY